MSGPNSSQPVAVVIPCFNGEATLAEAIDSAIAQQLVNEIVVIDDGSTDGSPTIAARYGGKVRLLAGPNAGVSAARNRGIDATTAPLIQFLDADDILLPGTIAQRLAELASANADAIVTDWSDFRDESGRRIVAQPRSAPFDDLAADAELSCMTRFWAPPAAILFRREIVERAGRFRTDYRTLEDARFLFDVARVGGGFRRSGHVGMLYRVHAGSKSRSDPVGFWLMALRKAMDVELDWRRAGTFTAIREARLAEVYNGVVAALFYARSPEYWTALGIAAEKGVPLTRKNQLARRMARSLGLDPAVAMARLYTLTRRRLRGAGPVDGAPLR